MLFIKIIIPLAISALSLYFVSRSIHLDDLKNILAQSQPFPVLFAILTNLVTFYLRGVRWGILLAPFKKLPHLTLVRWQIGGIFINNILPYRLGEVARAYWAGHKAALSRSQVFATIVIERLADISALFVMAIVFFIILSVRNHGAGPYSVTKLLTMLAVFLVGGGVAYFILQSSKDSALAKVRKFAPHKMHAILEKFLEGLTVLKSKEEAVKVGLISFVIWSLDIAAIMVASYSLGLNLSWVNSGILMVGLVLGVMIPAAPGAIGTYEAGGQLALSLIGITGPIALSFVILIHAFQYCTVLVLGIPILFIEGFNPKSLFKEMNEEAAQEKEPQNVP